MGSGSNAPVIIKRKKVVGGDGHHGGAWKVAYADFVTAMMAFFLLMWLLNATTEQQRKGIADYFAPTVAVNRISGGGDDMFGGDSVFADESLARNGTGAILTAAGNAGLDIGDSELSDTEAADRAVETRALEEIEAVLLGQGGESFLSDTALQHVVTRLTDEGLIIEIFAVEGAPIFNGDTDQPRPVLRDIAGVMARSFSIVENPVVVEAHIRARPLVVANHPVWDLSTGRAEAMRRMLVNAGLQSERVERLTGHGDREPAVENTLSVRNDRIEIILLRDP